MKNKNKIYDVIGVGFGPANIALAIGLEEIPNNLDVLFLEKKTECTWQPGMLFEDSDIQNHPLRDLVTPRNPRSKYSFTNFLFEKGRLFEHLNLGMSFPFRLEYEQYVRWAASYFEHQVSYGVDIRSIELTFNEALEGFGYELRDQNDEVYYCKQVVIAPGRTPNIPEVFKAYKSERIIHLNDYLQTIEKLKKGGVLNSIAVVGGSQSSIEIILNLSAQLPDAEIYGFCKPFGYKMKDVSPFTGEVYFPEFAELFYDSNKSMRRKLIKDLHHTNYSAADADVLDQLYRKIYQQKITDSQKIFIERASNIVSVNSENDIELTYSKVESQTLETKKVDLVILATGFKNFGTQINEESHHSIFNGLLEHLVFDEEKCLDVNFDYSAKMKSNVPEANKCFVNGLCESTHGMGDAGSFSLLSLRSEAIIKGLLQTSSPTNKQEEKDYILN